MEGRSPLLRGVADLMSHSRASKTMYSGVLTGCNHYTVFAFASVGRLPLGLHYIARAGRRGIVKTRPASTGDDVPGDHRLAGTALMACDEPRQ